MTMHVLMALLPACSIIKPPAKPAPSYRASKKAVSFQHLLGTETCLPQKFPCSSSLPGVPCASGVPTPASQDTVRKPLRCRVLRQRRIAKSKSQDETGFGTND